MYRIMFIKQLAVESLLQNRTISKSFILQAYTFFKLFALLEAMYNFSINKSFTATFPCMAIWEFVKHVNNIPLPYYP